MMFFQKVNHSSRKAMVDFLTKHPRYWTMNSWNQLHSYAHNVKISHLDIPKDLLETAYEFQEVDGEETPWIDIRDEWLVWSYAHNRDYEIGMNGRSNGYMVLFQTEKKTSQYKSWCAHCGQRNYCRVVPDPARCADALMPRQVTERQALNEVRLGTKGSAVEALGWTDDFINTHILPKVRQDAAVNGKWTANKCGRCGAVDVMQNYKEPLIEVKILNTGLDQDRDFESWDMSSLRQRVDLIQDFDRCVDSCRDIFVECCRNYKVIEQQIMVPRTVKIVVSRETTDGNSGEAVADAG